MAENERVEFNKDELSAIQKDIESAKATMVSEETKKQIQEAKEQARLEVEKEVQINQKIKEQEALIEQLRQEKVNQEKSFNDKFQEVESKLSEAISSKAPVSVENPFKSSSNDTPMTADNMSDEQIAKIEHESGVAFLGDEYNKPM